VPRPLVPALPLLWDTTRQGTDEVTSGQHPILCLGKEDGMSRRVSQIRPHTLSVPSEYAKGGL